MNDPISPVLAEKLSYHLEHGLDLFILQMDLEGLDTSDEAFNTAAWKQAKQYLIGRRFESGVLPRFRALMLTNADLGQVLGYSKSMIQAIVGGRLHERYTPKQKADLQRLIAFTRDECSRCLDALG